MERIDLELVGEEFDDDDRRGKADRHANEHGLRRGRPECQGDECARNFRQEDLTDPGEYCSSPQRADERHVKLEPDEEEEDGNTDLAEGFDEVGRGQEPHSLRPGDEAHGDERHDERLARGQAQKPREGGEKDEQGDFGEGMF